LKDEFNALIPISQPGFLSEALGAGVSQFYALEKAVPVNGPWGEGEASIWAERMAPSGKDVEVLLRYGRSNGWLDGQPAVVSRPVGRGRITYIGAVLDEKLVDAAARWMTNSTRITSPFGLVPDGIEVSRRVGSGSEVFILINLGPAQTINLPREMNSLLDHQAVSKVSLSRYGVAVLQAARDSG